MQTILLGMKPEPYIMLEKHFKDNFDVMNNEINTFDDLKEACNAQVPDVLILAERFLDFKEAHITEDVLNFIDGLPKNVRICYICVRKIDDTLFDELKERGVQDIFYTAELSISRIVQQLKRRPTSENVVFYGTVNI
ncbi:hypothetical protein ACMHYP_23045 [Bacillus cereus]|uniref:hypothetical protein n=1 Tax=Bacillus cereus group TaxID=86661 RepID=UPI003014BDF5